MTVQEALIVLSRSDVDQVAVDTVTDCIVDLLLAQHEKKLADNGKRAING